MTTQTMLLTGMSLLLGGLAVSTIIGLRADYVLYSVWWCRGFMLLWWSLAIFIGGGTVFFLAAVMGLL